MVLALALLLEVVAVFGTGNFMFSRVAAVERDFSSRIEHWRNGLGLLQTPAEWLLGIGAGRLPASYARFVAGREFSGAVRWVESVQGQSAARLSGPKTQNDLGGLFALTQRVPLQPLATYLVEFDSHVSSRTLLALSVCEMHLLYPRRCQRVRVVLQPGQAAWQRHAVRLHGAPLAAGSRYAPRRALFAMSVLNAGGEVDLGDVVLRGGSDADLLRNGGFDRELAHWLPSAQLYFLPWHIDNLYLEWLIERGAVGVLAFAMLASLALRNLWAGPARGAALAPFVAAGLCGALIVGLFSSVLDAPRIAFLMFLLLGVALALGNGTRRPA
jgi:hypothetical protein